MKMYRALLIGGRIVYEEVLEDGAPATDLWNDQTQAESVEQGSNGLRVGQLSAHG